MSERLYDYSDMPGDNDIVCRGSYALGSACGRCQRCLNDLESQLAELRAAVSSVIDWGIGYPAGISDKQEVQFVKDWKALLQLLKDK